jgi:hypothetical protein
MEIALIDPMSGSLRLPHITGQIPMRCSGSKIGKIAGDENDFDC